MCHVLYICLYALLDQPRSLFLGIINYVIASCSNAATTPGLGHSTRWRRTEQRVSSTVTIQSTHSSTVSVTRIHTPGAASTQTTVSSITKFDQSTPVATMCHRSWVGFVGAIHCYTLSPNRPFSCT